MFTSHDSSAYQAIAEFYRGKYAKRSGVPYMNHIDEGLVILRALDARYDASAAFCIHPIVQRDSDFLALLDDGGILQKYGVYLEAVLLAMEYRSIANSYLPKHVDDHAHVVPLSCSEEVNRMLIADKVQNFKDFERYHEKTHPQAGRLRWYFQSWLGALRIGPERYKELKKLIE